MRNFINDEKGLVGIVVVIVAIIVLGVLGFAGYQAYQADSQDTAENNTAVNNEETASEAGKTDCGDDQKCLNEKLAACEPATYQMSDENIGIAYEIFGPDDNGCEMELVYTENPNPEWVDKELRCSFDNELGLEDSVREKLEEVTAGNAATCSGPLVSVLQNS